MVKNQNFGFSKNNQIFGDFGHKIVAKSLRKSPKWRQIATSGQYVQCCQFFGMAAMPTSNDYHCEVKL